MKEIRIIGLRSLLDTTSIRIAPITVLLGENSSGKSTFLRTFPLLRQTTEVRTSEPLLWYGRLVDFGSFEESLSKFKDNKSIEFEFLIDMDPRFTFFQRRIYAQDRQNKMECKVRFSVMEGPSEHPIATSSKVVSFLKKMCLDICDIKIELEFTSIPEICKLVVDGVDFTQLAKLSFRVGTAQSLTPTLFTIKDSEKAGGKLTLNDEIHNFVKTLVHQRTKNDSIDELPLEIELASAGEMLASIKARHQERGLWKKEVLLWSEDSLDFIHLRRLIWATRLEYILDSLAHSLRQEASAISYITPLRAAAERYYRQQGLATNELDAKGENFALFLKSLTSRDRESLRKWLSTSLGVYVESDETRGHVSLYLVDEKTKNRVNLADTGFGYSQLLPIAVQLWHAQTPKRNAYYPVQSGSNSLIVIEQPELHLHPRIQAKVADLMAHTVSSKQKNKTNVIIETHSEALVNRLGKLVANGSLSPSDVSVILFNKPQFSEPTEVTKTFFDSNGFLQDWPLGFFNSD